MPMSRLLTSALLLSLLFTSLLTGCGQVVTRPAASKVEKVQQQADLLESNGDYQGAANLYLARARETGPPERDTLLLLAAGSLVRGGEPSRATSLLDGMTAEQLTDSNRTHYTLVRAAIALAEQRPDTALSLLKDVPTSGPFIADYRRLRAQARSQNSQYFQAARERILLDPLLTDPQAQLANRRATWEMVNSLTDRELQTLRTAPPPDVMSGWMELVELTRLYLQQPDALADVTPHWQQRYPGHPASGGFLDDLLGTMRAAGKPPHKSASCCP